MAGRAARRQARLDHAGAGRSSASATSRSIARRDEALDKGETLGILGRLRVGDTVYRNVLRVLETNPFEPKDARDQVLCARGSA